MSQMTPRERIITALSHKEPDRVPIDFGGRVTTVHAFTHRDLKRYLGLEGGEERIRDYHTYVVEPDPRLVEMFGRDTVPVTSKPGRDWQFRIDPSTNSYIDEWGTKYYMPPDGYFFDIAEPAMASIETVEDLARYRFPDPSDPARLEGVADAVAAARAAENAVMMCSARVGIWASLWYLRGFEQSYIDLASNLKLTEALAEALTDWHIAYWNMVLDAVGDEIDVVHIEGDAGGA